jgi:hypothetical protein
MSMTDNFVDHTLKFAAAEGLERNETSLHVLADNAAAAVQARADILDAATTMEQLLARQQLSEEIKKDPAYKFLLQVAAFSQRRINKLTEDLPIQHRTIAKHGALSTTVCAKNEDREHQWLQIPEISGVVHLSTDAYGHIKEAQTIANNFIHQSLKTLIEHEQYQTLFARLVAIRMGLSTVLAHSDVQKDRTFERLHQEQTMVLRSLQQVRGCSSRRIWTEPGYY